MSGKAKSTMNEMLKSHLIPSLEFDFRFASVYGIISFWIPESIWL